MRSRVTGLELGVLEGWLRLYDPATGERLLTPEEEAEAHREEARARLKAEQARQAAEAESARLTIEPERLRMEIRRRPQ